MLPDWLSTAETAELLGLQPRDVYCLIDQGDLPAYRFGRVSRLKAGDVERYRDDGTAGAPAEV